MQEAGITFSLTQAGKERAIRPSTSLANVCPSQSHSRLQPGTSGRASEQASLLEQPWPSGIQGPSKLLGPWEQPQPLHVLLIPHQGPGSPPKPQHSKGLAILSPGLGRPLAPACPQIPSSLSGATSSKAASGFGLAGDATAGGQSAHPELCSLPRAKAWRTRRMKPSTPQLGSGACPRQGALSHC